MPSLNENFGNVVVEALAVGTPVICTEGVGAGDVVRRIDPGCVVPRTVAALSGILSDLLSDLERRSRFRSLGPEIVDASFTWKSIAASMTELYSRVQAGPVSEAVLMPATTTWP